MLVKTLQFSFIILFGSFSYDILKTLIYMDQDKFWEFCLSIKQGFLWFFCTVIVSVAIVFLDGENMYVTITFCYLLFMYFTLNIARSIIASIEVATSKSNGNTPQTTGCNKSN